MYAMLYLFLFGPVTRFAPTIDLDYIVRNLESVMNDGQDPAVPNSEQNNGAADPIDNDFETFPNSVINDYFHLLNLIDEDPH